jgi:type II secretory pathway component GspD/PulD (secretin)
MTDLTEANSRNGTAKTVAPAAQTPWPDHGDDDAEAAPTDPDRARRVREIIGLIEDTVAPGSWRDRGGAIGNISEINGQLVITQNTAGQRAIGDLLGKLRDQRAIQIAVEARFITVSSHYLEQLGMDLNVVFNSGNAGYDYVPGPNGVVTDPVLGNPLLLPRSFSRLGFTPATPPLGVPNTGTPAGGSIAQPYNQPYLVPQTSGTGNNMTPIPMSNRVSSFTDPANLGSDVPGSFAGQSLPPALSIFGSFLDNIQVDFLIRATQADSRTTVLTAPQLVLFNGQRSWVAVTIQQNFVSTLNPVVATGAVAQAPQIGTIDSGAVLDVNATVTADKRYVTMTIRPGVTRLLDLQTIPFSGGSSGGGFGGGPALTAFVQLPTLSSQRIQTTVSVPDGGTLLIGGQKLASETEVEAGVPVLSKIPILKRAYSSRSMVKDEQTLLILIKPKILIQSEQEELAFPSFSRR